MNQCKSLRGILGVLEAGEFWGENGPHCMKVSDASCEFVEAFLMRLNENEMKMFENIVAVNVGR
jgi:hypothetical protein